MILDDLWWSIKFIRCFLVSNISKSPQHITAFDQMHGQGVEVRIMAPLQQGHALPRELSVTGDEP